MNPLLFLLAFLTAIGIFTAGVLVHKYVISEALAIKQHVSDEIAEARAEVAQLRSDLAEFLKSAAAKV